MATGSATWEIWSTTATLVVTDPAALAAARVVADDWLSRVDDAANRFRADSEISSLQPGWTRLSPVLAELVRVALRAAAWTDGAVDPTVGTALAEIGYDRDIRLVADTGPMRVVARMVPGWRRLRLSGDLLWLPRNCRLDLGATAKAAAADRVASLVSEELGVGVLAGLGGDLAAAGAAPPGGWQVRVQDLPEDPAQQVTIPEGGALATSSTVRRRWQRGTASVHHIVDPSTGRPAEPVWRSVSVAARTCARANAASTAAVVLGSAAPEWLAAKGLPARLVGATGEVVGVGDWPEEAAA